MVSFGKRLGVLAVTGALAIAGLAGCGQAAPKSSQELVSRWMAAENKENYHADISYGITLGVLGQSMDMNMDMNMDMAGSDGYMTTTVTAFGEESNMESYITSKGNDVTVYTGVKQDDGVTWTSTTTTAEGASLSDALLEKNLLDNAEFSEIDGGYQLSISGEKLMEALSKTDTGGDVTSSFDELESLGVDFKSAFDDSTAVYTFDKDCMPKSLEWSFSYDDDTQTEGMSLNLTLDLDLRMTMSGWGTIDPDSVVVPDDVVAAAIPTDTDELADLLEDTTDDLDVELDDEEEDGELDEAA